MPVPLSGQYPAAALDSDSRLLDTLRVHDGSRGIIYVTTGSRLRGIKNQREAKTVCRG